MIAVLRQLVFLLLMIAIPIGALAIGHASGQPRVAGKMVICVGAEVVIVTVDQDGQPVAPRHVCPDCILTWTGLPAASENAALGIFPTRLAYHRPVAARVASFPTTETRARAPPVPV